MRILEYGHIKPKEVKCNHCGAILEYIPNDLKYSSGTYYLVCPVCGRSIYSDNGGNEFVKRGAR